MPSEVRKVAPTGQTCTHGGLAQWLHNLGRKNVLRISMLSAGSSGNPSIPPFGLSTLVSPSVEMTYLSTHVLKYMGSFGTLFSFLQASAQRPQPMHLAMLI